MTDENIHRLHIKIPRPLYDELIQLLPDRGGIANVVRNMLRVYLLSSKRIGGRPTAAQIAEAMSIMDLERGNRLDVGPEQPIN